MLKLFGNGPFETDLSNATISNRFHFKTNVLNSYSILGIMPNGAGTNSQLQLFNSSTPDVASSMLQLTAQGSAITIQSSITGTGTYLPLSFYTGGSERLRIETNGRVGIGVAATRTLHVKSTDNWVKLEETGGRSYLIGTGTTTDFRIYDETANTDRLKIDSNGNINIPTVGARITGDFSTATISNRVMFQTSTISGNTIISGIGNGAGTGSSLVLEGGDLLTTGNSSTGQLNLIPGSEVRITSGIRGTGTYLPIVFYTSSTDRLRIQTDGVVSLSSGQLKFPATQLPSTDVNTLDDYREGTWTPAFQLASPGTSSFTYTVQQGTYVKVGKLAVISFRIECSASSAGTGTGNLRIINCPFTNTGSIGWSAGSIGFAANWTTSSPTSCMIGQSSPNIEMWAISPTASSSSITHGNIGNAIIVYGSISFQTTA